jgi:hypothetical protein
VLVQKENKQVPEKVGMKGVTRDGMDYEFTLVFELDMKNSATATKDRTSLFIGKPEFVLTHETGKKILEWCNQGQPDQAKELTERISGCTSMDELLKLYYANPAVNDKLKEAFTKKRKELAPQTTLSTVKPNKNGTVNSNSNR